MISNWKLLFLSVVLWATTLSDAFDHDVGGDSSSSRTGYACEGSTLSITCPENARIVIQRANYGRFNPSICNEGRNPEGWDMQCMSTRSLSIVTDMCQDKQSCSVMAANSLFGDTCENTYKYLEIEYICARVSSTTPTPPSSLVDVFEDVHEKEEEEGNEDSEELEETTSDRPLSSTVVTSSTSGMLTSTVSVMISSNASSKSTSTINTVPDVEFNDAGDSGPRPLPIESTDNFCEAVKERHVMWPKAAAGTTVEMICPNNKEVRGAVWHCGSDPAGWVGRPDMSRCVSDSIANIKALADDTREEFDLHRLEIFADDLEVFTQMQEVVFGGDLTEVTTAMQEAVEEIDEHIHEIPTPVDGNEGSQLLQKVNDAVLTTSSYLLDDSRVGSWLDLPQATQAETATRLLSTVENSAMQLAKKCEQPTIIVNVTINIVLEIKVVDVSGSAPVEDAVFPQFDPAKHNSGSWSSSGDSIRLTGDTIRQLGVEGLAKMIFTTYSNLDKYLQPQNDGTNTFEELKAKPTSSQKYTHVPTSSSQFVHPQSDQEMGDVETDVMTVQYDEKKLSDELDGKFVNTKIISASFGDQPPTNRIPLKDPVIYTLEHHTKDNVYNPSCAFWEFSEKSLSGKWSTFGCQLIDTNLTHTTCACEHLTNFAVLMSLKAPNEKLSLAHEFTLSLMTYCGCVLSIVCLAAAFCTFFCFKNLQSDRNTIHKNLVASLLVAELVFIFGIVQYQNALLCSVIAGILHYLFLAAFAWMCLEGIQIYIMLVEVFEVEKSRVGWFYAAGYGIPAIIVATSAAIYPSGYGTPYHCWLKTDRYFIWSFVGPVCAIIFVNIIMLSIAIRAMCQHASSSAANWKTKDMSKLETIRAFIKGSVVLIVLLGPTWIVGVFYVSSQAVFMAYLFTILNSLQGVFIFVFHCLMNDKVIKEYKRCVRHSSWLPSNLRMRCGGTKANTPSTTPNNSSTSGVNRIMTQQKLSLEYLTRLLSNRRRKRSSTSTLPSTTNIVKRNGYMIQRNSSGRDSANLTDSGIACCHNDGVDGSSHIYSEPTTEDPSAYLDPIRIRLDPDEEMYWQTNGDVSIMEGSVADTDYMDNFGRRAPTADPSSPGSINIDKYKIRPPPPTFPLPAIPVKAGDPYHAKMLPGSAAPLSTDAVDHDMYRSDESLLRRKLLAMGETTDDYNDDTAAGSSVCSSSSTLMMNNLNKCSNDKLSLAGRDTTELSAPNITKTPPLTQPLTQPMTREVQGRVNRAMVLSLQRSLPSLCSAQPSESHTRQNDYVRSGHAPVCASVGCALDVVSCDGNSPSAEPHR